MSEDAFSAAGRAEYRYLVQVGEEEEEEEQYVRRRYAGPLQGLSRSCIFIIGLAVASLLCLAVYLAYESQTLPPGVTHVSTQCGDFRGRYVSSSPLAHANARCPSPGEGSA